MQKKHFAQAEAVIKEVLVTDGLRRKTQQELDACLAQGKKAAKEIGALMGQGRKEEAQAKCKRYLSADIR